MLPRGQGVRLIEQTPVLRLEETAGESRLVLKRGAMTFDRVVVAAGVWVGRLLPEVGRHVQVTHQQMVLIEAEAPSRFARGRMPMWSVDPDGERWYGFPLLREGYLKVSRDSLGEVVDPDMARHGTAAFVAQTRAFLRERIPEMAQGRVVGRRSCLYANTPDTHFVIDWVPGWQRVLVAGGGSGHGFKFGGSIGPVIADALEGKGQPAGEALPDRGTAHPHRRRTHHHRSAGLCHTIAASVAWDEPVGPGYKSSWVKLVTISTRSRRSRTTNGATSAS